MEYSIKISGCDDNTSFNMNLTEEELDLIKRISEKSKETSLYSCMPVLTVCKKFEPDDEDDE